MATILAVYHGGRCIGRCDRTCYEAKHDECSCICQGRNHGKGRQVCEAVFTDDDVERFATDRQIDPHLLVVVDRTAIRHKAGVKRFVRKTLHDRRIGQRDMAKLWKPG